MDKEQPQLPPKSLAAKAAIAFASYCAAAMLVFALESVGLFPEDMLPLLRVIFLPFLVIYLMIVKG